MPRVDNTFLSTDTNEQVAPLPPPALFEQLKTLIGDVSREPPFITNSTPSATSGPIDFDTESVDTTETTTADGTATQTVGKAAQTSSTPTAESRYQRLAFVDKRSTTLDANPLGTVGLHKLVRYGEVDGQEGDGPTFMVDARIYIQGIEISDYLDGAIQIDRNTVDGHNRVTFTLANEQDRFVWSEQNLQALFDTTKTNKFTAAESIKSAMFAYKADPVRNPPILSDKNVVQFARFDLAPNRAIFARMDPIRVFSLYPWRVPGGKDELWMPEFTGFVLQVSIEDDDITGGSKVTIEATDSVEAILARMRISTDASRGITNPVDFLGFAPAALTNTAGDVNSKTGGSPQAQALAAQALVETLSNRFFNPQQTQFYDDVIGSQFNQPFPQVPMEQAVTELLVFNEPNLNAGKGNRGVRAIELGGTITYDNTSLDQQAQRAFLQEWHRFCLFGPKRRPWTKDEVRAVGSETKTDGKFAPSQVRLWFLLPRDGSGSKNTADLSSASHPTAHEVNWTSRAEILRHLVSTIDYRMFVAPTGDFICEFPFADFRPEDFGEFKESFRFDKALVSSGFGDEAEDPCAALMLTTGFGVAAQPPSGGASNISVNLIRTLVFSPYIAARYGITVDNIQMPFLTKEDTVIAQQRAVVEFQKRNARCHTMEMSYAYRPFILPNRPLHHLKRTRMGLTVSTSTTLTFGSSPSVASHASLDHVRLWTGFYRSDANLATLKQLQLDALKRGGLTTTTAKGIDSTSGPDLIELQVYNSIMGGESLPVSARSGWGVAPVSPAAGVYLLDPKEVIQPFDTTAQPTDGVNKGQVGDVATAAPNPDRPETYKFPRAPLSTLIVTSLWGNRLDPITKKAELHAGVDFSVPEGTPLYAVDNAVVKRLGFEAAGGGNFIVLGTTEGVAAGVYEVKYLHMVEPAFTMVQVTTSSGSGLVKTPLQVGNTVTPGQPIGLSGNTGHSTGPHLHFQVNSKNFGGNSVDPLQMLPTNVPVKIVPKKG